MQCPKCGSDVSQVKNSRPTQHGIRRRRICPKGHRYTTYETTGYLTDQKVVSGLLDNVESALRAAQALRVVMHDAGGTR